MAMLNNQMVDRFLWGVDTLKYIHSYIHSKKTLAIFMIYIYTVYNYMPFDMWFYNQSPRYTDMTNGWFSPVA